MKKYLLITIGLIFIIQAATAQITINLALANRPQPWLSDWANPVNGQLIISFIPGPIAADPNIKLRTTLTDESGAILASSNTSAARVYRLRDGANQFSIADALQLENLTLMGRAKSLLQRTGRLAAGQYLLTVEALNTAGDVVRAKQTRPFFITSYQLPMLTAPANETNLEARVAQNVIIFRWTSLVPGTPELPIYRIQVFEILSGQTPMQAYRGNRPLLNDQVIKGATQYVWRTNLPMLDSTANKRFIWTIQTFDKNGMPIPNLDSTSQGRSEPAIFNIVRNIGLPKQNYPKENE
jgi:hypothetical protein